RGPHSYACMTGPEPTSRSALRPPSQELFELDGPVAVTVDLVEADLRFFRRDVLVEILHVADEFAEREAAVLVQIVEVEVLAQPPARFGGGLHVVERGSVAVVVARGHGSPPSHDSSKPRAAAHLLPPGLAGCSGLSGHTDTSSTSSVAGAEPK